MIYEIVCLFNSSDSLFTRVLIINLEVMGVATPHSNQAGAQTIVVGFPCTIEAESARSTTYTTVPG